MLVGAGCGPIFHVLFHQLGQQCSVHPCIRRKRHGFNGPAPPAEPGNRNFPDRAGRRSGQLFAHTVEHIPGRSILPIQFLARDMVFVSSGKDMISRSIERWGFPVRCSRGQHQIHAVSRAEVGLGDFRQVAGTRLGPNGLAQDQSRLLFHRAMIRGRPHAQKRLHLVIQVADGDACHGHVPNEIGFPAIAGSAKLIPKSLRVPALRCGSRAANAGFFGGVKYTRRMVLAVMARALEFWPESA